MGIRDIIYLILFIFCSVVILQCLFSLLIFLFEMLSPKFERFINSLKNRLKGGVL
jgi:hypothetical protein